MSDDGYGIIPVYVNVTAATSALVNERQTLTPSAAPSTGSVKFTFVNNQGETIGTTDSIAYDATQGEIQTAIEGVLGSGSCVVVGTFATTVEMNFQGDFAAQSMGETTVSSNTMGVTFTYAKNVTGVSAGALVVPSVTNRRIMRYLKVRIRANSGVLVVGGGCDALNPVYGRFDNTGEYEISLDGLGDQRQNKNTGIYYDNASGAATDDIDITLQYHNERQF